MASSYLKALERYRLKAATQSQKELSIHHWIEEHISDYVYLREQDDEESQAELVDLVDKINSESLKLKHEETRRKMGAAKTLAGSTLSTSRPKELAGRISGYTRSPSVRLGAVSDIERIPSTQLERTVEHKRNMLESFTNKLRGTITETGVDESKYEKYASAITKLEKDIARHQLTIGYQARQGVDPAGIMASAQESLMRADKNTASSDVQSRIASGNFDSLATETATLENKVSALRRSIEALSEATDDERDSKTESVKQAKKEYEEQQELVSKIKGDKEGGGGAYIANTIAQAVSKALSSFSIGYQQVAMHQPLRAIENQTRFMQMNNEQYMTMRAMTEGDQMSLIKMMGMYGSSQKFAEEFFGKGQTYMGAQSLASTIGAIGTVVGGTAATLATTALSGGTAGAIVGAGAAGAATESIANTASVLADYSRNITAGMTAIQARDTFGSLFKAINEIPALQRQSYEDQYRRSYRSTIGFGIGGQMMSELMDYRSDSMLSQLSKLNVSPERAAALAALGGRTVGGRDLTMQSLRSAAIVERGGLTSAEQYMQLLGGLTDVGGRNQDLYNVMKSAVTIGMDDSKNISRMVSATVSIADKGAVRGMMTATGVNDAIIRAANFNDNNLMTKSQRMRVATSTAEGVNTLLSRGGTDIYSLQELAGITEAVRGTGVSQSGRIYLEKAGLNEMTAMRALLGDPKSEAYRRAQASLTEVGLGDLVGRKDVIRELIGVKTGTVMKRIMGLGTEFSQKERQYAIDVFSGREKVNSFDEFIEGMDKIGGKGANELRSRAATENLMLRSVFSLLQGKTVEGTEIDKQTALNRFYAAEKMTIGDERKFLESKTGRDAILKAMDFERWKETQRINNEALLMSADPKTKSKARAFLELSDDDLKKRFMDTVAPSVETEYMRNVVKKSLGEDEYKKRVEEAARQMAPGDLVDVTKDFSSATSIFDKSVRESFAKSVDILANSVKSIEGLTSRPDNAISSNLGMNAKDRFNMNVKLMQSMDIEHQD